MNRAQSPPATAHTTDKFELVEPDSRDGPDPTRTVTDTLDTLIGKPPRLTPTDIAENTHHVRAILAAFDRHNITPTDLAVKTLVDLYQARFDVGLTRRALARHADMLITQAENGRLFPPTSNGRDREDAQRRAEYADLAARKTPHGQELEAGT